MSGPCNKCPDGKLFDKKSKELKSCPFTVKTMPKCLSVVGLPEGVTIALDQLVDGDAYPYPCPADQVVLSADMCSYTINKPGDYQLTASGGVGEFIVMETAYDASAFPQTGPSAGDVKAIAQACVDAALAELPEDVSVTDLTINEENQICAVLSDGQEFCVTITDDDVAETDGVHVNGAVPAVVDIAAGTITYQTVNDADESAGEPYVVDISQVMISTSLLLTMHRHW